MLRPKAELRVYVLAPLPCAMSRNAPATWTVHASHAGASYAGETISQVSPCLEHERRAALAVHAVRWECVFDGICEDLARTQALFCMSPLRAGSAGHALFASRPHGQNGTRTSIVNTMMHAHLLSGGGPLYMSRMQLYSVLLCEALFSLHASIAHLPL